MTDRSEEIARFERYVELDPHNAALWVRYGDVLHQAGRFDRAEQAFRTSLQLNPGSSIAVARLAMVEISRQNFAAAERMLRELVDAEEQDPIVRFNLGLSLYYQREFAAAVQEFDSLSQRSDLPDARYYLLSCLHNLSRLDEARERAHQFLAQQPSAKLRGYLALLEMDAGRMQRAVDHAREVLREQPDNADAAAVLSTHCMEADQMDEAQRHLSVLLAREPRNVRAWQGMALVALHREQHEEAVRLLERARQCAPENTGTMSTLGWVHITQHQYERAAQVFRDGLDIDRNDAELHGGLATALVFQRQFEEAKREAGRALGLDKRCFGALFAQSVMLKLEGHDQLAATLFANVLQSSPRAGGSTLLDGLVAHWRQQGVIPRAPSEDERP